MPHNEYPKKVKIYNHKKLARNLNKKKKYVTHIRSLEQALNHRLRHEKAHRVIKFHQKYLSKPYIGLNIKLEKEQIMIFERISTS